MPGSRHATNGPMDFLPRTEVGFTGKTPLRARGDIFQKAVTTLGFQIGYAQGKVRHSIVW